MGGYKKCTILLPIKPEYANKIVDQTKLYEYRKNICKRDSDKIVIYSTSPVKRFITEVEVKVDLIIKFTFVRRFNIMERVAGIEPALPGRKHGILPLNYTRT